MIRVIQYIGSMKIGGSQSMIMDLYRNIDREIIQFDFVIHADGITPLAIEAQKMGAIIYECPRYCGKTARSYSKWWNDFFKQHPEYKIVHSHVRSTASIVLNIAKKHGCKTIAHSHSTSSGGGINAIVKNLFQYQIRFIADYFIGCSQEAGEWLFGKRVCISNRYFIVRNAIDSKKYIYDEIIANSVRKELGYSKNEIVIGHVGRFSKPKNHMFLLNVFNEIHKKNKQYKLLLVGDGELRDDIEQKIYEYGLSNEVTLLGVRSDVNRLMMAMDLFLFPSLWEGLPVSVVEAQAAGLPCVISDSITKEVCITPLVKQISLKCSIDEWCKYITHNNTAKRSNTQQAIIDANYDIHNSAVWITKFYLSLC